MCVHDSLFNAGIMEIDEGIPPICKTHGQVCEQEARNQDSVVDGLATSQKLYFFSFTSSIMCVCILIFIHVLSYMYTEGEDDNCLMYSSLNCHLYMFVATSSLPSQLCGYGLLTSVLVAGHQSESSGT